jgi:hypothetical protein
MLTQAQLDQWWDAIGGEDETRIVRVAAEHGVEMTTQQAQIIWMLVSANQCATWLVLPKQDDQLWLMIEIEES